MTTDITGIGRNAAPSGRPGTSSSSSPGSASA